MKRWRLGAPALALVLALVAGACGGDDADSTAAGGTSEAGTLTIALGGPFSGPSKATGDNIRTGADLAAAEVNDAGGIAGGPDKGLRIVFREFDDAGVPANGASNMRTIIDDDDVVAFVGSGISDVSVAMAPLASREGFPFLSAYASSEKILDAAADAKTVFVVPPTFPAYAFSVTDELLKAGHTRPGILHATGTFGDGIANLVVERLKEKGVTPVANESFTMADTDFRVQLARIKDATPDSLVMVGLAPIDALILTQADELGLDVPVFDPGGITNNDTFLTAAGALAEGVVGNTPTLASRATAAAVVAARPVPGRHRPVGHPRPGRLRLRGGAGGGGRLRRRRQRPGRPVLAPAPHRRRRHGRRAAQVRRRRLPHRRSAVCLPDNRRPARVLHRLRADGAEVGAGDPARRLTDLRSRRRGAAGGPPPPCWRSRWSLWRSAATGATAWGPPPPSP